MVLPKVVCFGRIKHLERQIPTVWEHLGGNWSAGSLGLAPEWQQDFWWNIEVRSWGIFWEAKCSRIKDRNWVDVFSIKMITWEMSLSERSWTQWLGHPYNSWSWNSGGAPRPVPWGPAAIFFRLETQGSRMNSSQLFMLPEKKGIRGVRQGKIP